LDITVYNSQPNEEKFNNQDARDFTVPLKNETKDENIIILLNAVKEININKTKDNKKIDDMINTTERVSQFNKLGKSFFDLYNLTNTLFIYQNAILWQSENLDEYKKTINMLIGWLINSKEELSVEQKFLLGGLRSLYNKLNAQANTQSQANQ